MESNQFTGMWEAALGVLGTAIMSLATAFWWIMRDRLEVAKQIDRLEIGLTHLRETYADGLDESQSQMQQHRDLHDAVIRLESDVRAIKERLDRGNRSGHYYERGGE